MSEFRLRFSCILFIIFLASILFHFNVPLFAVLIFKDRKLEKNLCKAIYWSKWFSGSFRSIINSTFSELIPLIQLLDVNFIKRPCKSNLIRVRIISSQHKRNQKRLPDEKDAKQRPRPPRCFVYGNHWHAWHEWHGRLSIARLIYTS